MPPRPRDAPPAPGLLASAFSFVSREIESFVTAATGGEPSHKARDQPEASSSRVTLDRRRRERDEGREGKAEREKEKEKERRKRVRKRSEVESERARPKRRAREDGDGERLTRAVKRKSSQVVQREREKEREKEKERSSEREAADDEDDELPVKPLPKSNRKKRDVGEKTFQHDVHDVEGLAGDEPQPVAPAKKPAKGKAVTAQLMPPPPNPMPPPPTLLTARLMTPFPTMPGSLFPRSSSMMPESIPPSAKRVVPRPHTRSPPPIIEEEAEHADPPKDSSVDAAFEESPLRGRSPNRSRVDSMDKPADRAEMSSARESSRHSDVSGRAASSLRKSFEDTPEPTARPRLAKGKERAYDTSGEIRVRGVERELREAREDHARNAHGRDDSEREKDKRRIRMLEEEVARLRAELALKNSVGMGMMVPPPPPPPPPLMRVQAPSSSEGTTEGFLASARAKLKHTVPPVEAPINSVVYGGGRTRKAGQPTVNVPSDKMAAFLREMKSVRLRRVGGPSGSMGPPLFPAHAAGDVAGELTRSTSGKGMSDARRAAILGDMSFDAGVAARIFIGEKRKREEPVAGPSKRREMTFFHSHSIGGPSSVTSSQASASSSQSSSQTSASGSQSSSQTSSSTRSSLFEVGPSTTHSATSRSKGTVTLRIWPTRSTETDITTPSLCSDNDNDHSEDRLPETPSDSGRGNGRNYDESRSTVVPMEQQPQHPDEREIIDVDALETPPKALPGHPVEEEKKDLFARRPPQSPIPSKSPVKPKPPARAKTKIPVPSKLPLPRRVPVVPPQQENGSESDDPLLMARTTSESGARGRVDEDGGTAVADPSRVSAVSSERSRSQSHSHSQSQGEGERSSSRLSNHARRRLTLDEELKRAGDSLWRGSSDDERSHPPSEPEEDLDSGNLVAMGMRSSKRGFLARGGAAGAPVFMGEGYVQGVSGEDWEEGRSRNASTSRPSRSRRRS